MTDQQKLFATEYARTGNATQSAIYAGYSKATAYSQGSRLLKNVEVAEMIEELQAEMAQELRDQMAAEASTAFEVLTRIMNDSDAKDADRIKCAVEVLDRTGYVAESRISIEAPDEVTITRKKRNED